MDFLLQCPYLIHVEYQLSIVFDWFAKHWGDSSKRKIKKNDLMGKLPCFILENVPRCYDFGRPSFIPFLIFIDFL